MYLVIDECCGKKLGSIADDQGHAAQRTVEVAELGRGASDEDIFAFAESNRAVLVTINQADFLALTKRARARPGIILLPSLRGDALAKLFRVALPVLAEIFDAAGDAIVQVGVDGQITRLN